MSIQRYAAGACAVAGVVVLAGFGWGLLAASALLFVMPTHPELAARRVRIVAATVVRRLGKGRQAVAAAATPLAIVGLGVGVGLAFGVGWGLAVACVVIIGLALQVDRAE